MTEPVIFGEHLLRIEDVLAVAQRRAPARLQADETFRSRITRGAQFLDAETGERMTRGSTVQVAVEIASREMLLASPRVFVDAVERALA